MFYRHLLGILGMLFFALLVGAQEPPPIPTLIPPTPLPVIDDGASDALISESGLARIQADGRVRVGVLFNQPPFSELNIRGEVVGYDADLARSLAEVWGVEVEFVQVTRQTALDSLTIGRVDMLIAAQVHRRMMDEQVEFSQTYYRGGQAMMVRLDDPATTLEEMAGRRVGVVMGMPSEEAVAYWSSRTGATPVVQQYLTLGEALVALVRGEVDGVVDKRYVLRDRVQPDATRVLDATVQPEPYGVVVRRQDVNLRNLIDRTLQYLAITGRMAEIHSAFFPSRYPEDTIPLWEGLGESAPTPNTYGTDVPYPAEYTIPRIRTSGVLRVAGVPAIIPDEPEAARRLAMADRALAEALAARWGVSVQFVADTEADPVGAVARGQADLALGVRPAWDQAERVDFTGAYLLRGKRMMTPVREDYTSLAELRGKWVGVFASEPGASEQVVELGRSVNAQLRTFSVTRDEDAAFEMLVENNVDVMFGDSVRLIPHIEADPENLKFSDRCDGCDPWYTREYYGAAVPRNDLDFRLLMEYTLQEMAVDGTLASLLEPVTVRGEGVTVAVWPGPTTFMGFNLGQ